VAVIDAPVTGGVAGAQICLQLPAPRWTPVLERDGQPVAGVAIIGGGMAGLALAAAAPHKVLDVRVYDESPAGWEGPWAITARMQTLRSPKQLAGPAPGIPSLTFHAWCDVQWGRAAWDALDKIPRLQWMDDLRWYRRALGLVVHNGHRVTDVLPRGDGVVALQIDVSGRAITAHARHLVLATGRASLGGPDLPRFVRGMPAARWAHSSDFVHGHARLPDVWKCRIRHCINVQQVPPPRNSTLRVSRHANAHVHLGCAVEAVSERDGASRVDTSQGPIALDFLIVATGFVVDWTQRPMLRHIAPLVRLWQHRWQPPADEADAELSASPDLGPRSSSSRVRAPGDRDWNAYTASATRRRCRWA
jgi:cation diffusion facilitator CzcD-associated flavoprotein CzcO